ncbi:tRNA pseudouridine(38-40) synthase TruA [Rhodohalobacter halophilus]|uniref:tRNA pseudouridine(38-40) synthase TruA n=1 Tax=Rhodohalobacter halophilus TaxID=1812810 RepID=UPI00083FB30C|nr:tRNA pseudouridine(38-40) synthase TruA [Rhodohalobacter halophilus]
MQRYLLTFEFDGTDFNGWQRQPEGRTVEGVIENALSQMYQQDVNIIGQGRTDAGVHAKRQTAHVDLPDRYTTQRVIYAMRGLLPHDVALIDMQEVSSDFHARFHATSRSYQYRISTKPIPLQRNTVWFNNVEPDRDLLQRCSKLIFGEHDFINFCIPNNEDFGTTQCNIIRSEWEEYEDLLIYKIEGNRFLRHMVRRLVGSMMQVASGRLTFEQFTRLLNEEEVDEKAFAAPPTGLILDDVRYPGNVE